MSPIPHLFQRLRETIRTSDRVLLISHQKPDGDTLGAATALMTWMDNEGKQITAFCIDMMPEMYRYLDHLHRFTTDLSVFDHAYDLVLVLDSGKLDYAGVEQHIPRIPAGYVLANVDHHPTNSRYGDLVIVDSTASSTSELIHRFFSVAGVTIDSKISTSLLTGISYDTSNFTNGATTATSMEIASDLVAHGARIHDGMQNMWHAHTPDTLRLWGRILSRLKRYDAWDLAVTHVTLQDLEAFGTDIPSGFINFLCASISDADSVLVLRERPNSRIRGSMRSMQRPVVDIALAFGGGGHAKAPGFEMDGAMSYQEDGTVVIPERLGEVIEEVLGKKQEVAAS
jgi:phosphoesterase RecJ-like protein